MMTIDDNSLLTEFEQAECEDPSPKKLIDGTRTIYGSRKFGLPKNGPWGRPILCDFGQARIGPQHKGLIQPELYRAPEVLFDMNWDTSVDIWNVAVLVGSVDDYMCLLPTFALCSFLTDSILEIRYGIYSRIDIYSML